MRGRRSESARGLLCGKVFACAGQGAGSHLAGSIAECMPSAGPARCSLRPVPRRDYSAGMRRSAANSGSVAARPGERLLAHARHYELRGQIVAVDPRPAGADHQARRHQGLHAGDDDAVQGEGRRRARRAGPPAIWSPRRSSSRTARLPDRVEVTGHAPLTEPPPAPARSTCWRRAMPRRTCG